MKRRAVHPALVAAALLVACSRGGDETSGARDAGAIGGPGPGGRDAGPAPATFEEVQTLLLDVGCLECHGVTNHGLNLQLDRMYDQLVGRASTDCGSARPRVAPGRPESSYLVDKLKGTGPCFKGERMPRGCVATNSCLTPEQVGVVESWIRAGAKRE